MKNEYCSNCTPQLCHRACGTLSIPVMEHLMTACGCVSLQNAQSGKNLVFFGSTLRFDVTKRLMTVDMKVCANVKYMVDLQCCVKVLSQPSFHYILLGK